MKLPRFFRSRQQPAAEQAAAEPSTTNRPDPLDASDALANIVIRRADDGQLVILSRLVHGSANIVADALERCAEQVRQNRCACEEH